MGGFKTTIDIYEIVLRISMSIVIGGIIGYERGHRNRPAGFRTHILVCLGSAIVSLMQDILRINTIQMAMAHPETIDLFKTDLGRIGAQVVSGIGFLGAGTIMRDKGVIGGLTTAASIWATACIGLGIGWGFYQLAIPAGIAILIVLVTLKKVERSLIDNKRVIKVTVFFKEGSRYSENFLSTYEKIKLMNAQIKKVKKDSEQNKIDYELIVSRDINEFEITAELSQVECVAQVQMP